MLATNANQRVQNGTKSPFGNRNKKKITTIDPIPTITAPKISQPGCSLTQIFTPEIK